MGANVSEDSAVVDVIDARKTTMEELDFNSVSHSLR